MKQCSNSLLIASVTMSVILAITSASLAIVLRNSRQKNDELKVEYEQLSKKYEEMSTAHTAQSTPPHKDINKNKDTLPKSKRNSSNTNNNTCVQYVIPKPQLSECIVSALEDCETEINRLSTQTVERIQVVIQSPTFSLNTGTQQKNKEQKLNKDKVKEKEQGKTEENKGTHNKAKTEKLHATLKLKQTKEKDKQKEKKNKELYEKNTLPRKLSHSNDKNAKHNTKQDQHISSQNTDSSFSLSDTISDDSDVSYSTNSSNDNINISPHSHNVSLKQCIDNAIGDSTALVCCAIQKSIETYSQTETQHKV